MTPKAYPTQFDVHDHTDDGQAADLLATIKMQDEASASVEIKTVVNATEWAALAAEISRALMEMQLLGDRK